MAQQLHNLLLAEYRELVESSTHTTGNVSVGPDTLPITTADDAPREGIQGAQWSAVDDACPLCQFLDGKVISINHPDFSRFMPPLHDGCRCIRVYILDEEDGVKFDWETPPAELIHHTNVVYSTLPADELDPLFTTAVETVLDLREVSIATIRHELHTGYSRAAQIADQMEQRGVVGKPDERNRRQVVMSRTQWEEEKLAKS